MRIVRTVALLSVAASAAGAQDLVKLSIQATTGAEQRPVSGAMVVLDSGPEPAGRTDPRGEWSGGVSSGEHRLRLLSIGFRPRDTVLVIGRNDVTVRIDLAEAIVPLGRIIVTAARREQRLADAVVETEVISARDLERGPSDLASVLTERVGVQLDGGVPAGAGVQLRGFGSRRVLVLLDGQPLVGRVNGNLDLSRLPVSGIERIEIVKGPQSTLYGTDAIGGVINVITKQAAANGRTAALSTTAGSHGRTEITGDAAWRNGALSTAVNAGYNGIELVPGVSSDVATYSRRAHGGLRGGIQVDSALRVEWGGLTVVERQRYRTGQLFHFGDNVQASGRLGAERGGALNRVKATMSASTFDHLSRAATRDTPASDSGSRDRQRLLQGELLWNAVRGPRIWDAGVAVRREWIDADRLSEQAVAIVGVEPFTQATFSIGDVIVTPGARLSWSDRWGSFLAPRVSTLWRPLDGLSIRGSFGRGYRAPDFKELYLSFVNEAAGYAVYGNPDLRPERSTSVSLGSEFAGSRAFVRAAAFSASYRDFIETRAPDPNGVYTYGNINRGWTRGVELEAGFLAGDWRFDAAGERLWTRDDSTGASLLGRTPVTIRTSATGPLYASFRGAVRFAWLARTPINRDERTAAIEYRNAFPQLDVRLSRALFDRFELGGEVNNLLDRELGDAWPGFTGRRFAIRMRWGGDKLD